MPFTAFDRKLGLTQGRIEPSGCLPSAGSWVMCLGSDETGCFEELNVGDKVEVSQTIADTTGMCLVRLRATCRGPDAVVAGAGWKLSWFVDSVLQSSRIVWPSRIVDLDDLVFNLYGLTGTHILKVRLEVIAA